MCKSKIELKCDSLLQNSSFWQSHRLLHIPSPASIHSMNECLISMFYQFSEAEEKSVVPTSCIISVTLSVAVLELHFHRCLLFPFIYKWTPFGFLFVVFFFPFGKWQHFIKGEDSLPIKDVSAPLIKPLARLPAQQHPIINKSSRKEAFVTVYLLCFSSSPLISSSENWCTLRLEQWLWQLMVSVITAQISSAVATRSAPLPPLLCNCRNFRLDNLSPSASDKNAVEEIFPIAGPDRKKKIWMESVTQERKSEDTNLHLSDSKANGTCYYHHNCRPFPPGTHTYG